MKTTFATRRILKSSVDSNATLLLAVVGVAFYKTQPTAGQNAASNDVGPVGFLGRLDYLRLAFTYAEFSELVDARPWNCGDVTSGVQVYGKKIRKANSSACSYPKTR